MSTDLVSTETPTQTEPVAPEPQPEATSVADHAAQFGPEAQQEPVADPAPQAPTARQQAAAQRARDEASGKFAREQERHRAKSQQAKAEDVPRIKELTAKWRDAERRLEELQQRQQRLEKFATDPVPVPQQTPTSGFTKPKPLIEQFNDQDDPLEAWNLALIDWADDRRQFERARNQNVTETRTAETEARAAHEAWFTETRAAYAAKEAAFAAKQPNYRAAVDAVTAPTTPLLHQALLMSDNGPELVYYLATHPSVYDEMLLLTDGKQISEQTVALTQRQLAARSQAAHTGSAAAFVARSTPKPPNPVRTGPMPPADDPPGETSSIADHQRYYGRSR
jgi:hypothetical protein